VAEHNQNNRKKDSNELLLLPLLFGLAGGLVGYGIKQKQGPLNFPHYDTLPPTPEVEAIEAALRFEGTYNGVLTELTTRYMFHYLPIINDAECWFYTALYENENIEAMFSINIKTSPRAIEIGRLSWVQQRIYYNNNLVATFPEAVLNQPAAGYLAFAV
jgi:hypothetical protein